ncbi:SGNH/GDSL hydrolase family protein [Maribellus comscasis]|uniref:SGNH/GDSL hydrolase family protein n=1 Tax=Maribellus comscasis TaxID=2681766 RepID=A0A6I6JSF5_9BACT|nr:SGNH/GDSL hydrolase family protein [Maribellus comscasis]QGY43057.1 SGNH/GDSL hydrolase family protein [Maribellus comscasis]
MYKYLIILIALISFSGFQQKQKKVLIIGDSISIGYTPFVKEALADKATVVHNEGNGQHTGNGLKKLDSWLNDEKWDVIQFNWGLWDLCYRSPNSKEQGNRDKINGKITYSVEEYQQNLEQLVKKLKMTGAKLIFVTTSYVPENEAGRFAGDELKYNKVAKQIMKENGILVNDIWKTTKKIHKKQGQALNNVHYTPEGYKQIADKITSFLKKEL